MGRSVTPENNMRVMRPDIAHYMDLYNQYYGCSSNVPEQTSTYGTAMVYCRCEHGHDFHQKANKISQWIQDDKGVIYCPEADFTIYNTIGQNVTTQNGSLTPGVYLVQVADDFVKVMMK